MDATAHPMTNAATAPDALARWPHAAGGLATPAAPPPAPTNGMIGGTPAMREVFRIVRTVAPLRTTVLITGESGTGKELVAKAIHDQGARGARPFVALNCAAIPETLLESELFGHERGAFTDAHTRKLGQFELAHEGTLLLDEIAEMPFSMQAKLLRVLEHGEFLRVGGSRPMQVDVRIVAATNREIEHEVRAGRFRADLYYRLNIVRVHLPPLRERGDDLPLLIRHFVASTARMMRVPPKPITPEAMQLLLRYPWPGNIRELQNLVERLLVLTDDAVTPDDLPDHVRLGETRPMGIKELVLGGRKSLHAAIDDLEREIIVEALRRADYNVTRTAEKLGTTRRILKYRMDQLRIHLQADAA
jgi:two-component system response regulator AtoC